MNAPEPVEAPPVKTLQGELVDLIAWQATHVVVQAGIVTSLLFSVLLAVYSSAIYAAIWAITVSSSSFLYAKACKYLASDTLKSDQQKLEIIRLLFVWLTISISSLQLFTPFVPLTVHAIISAYIAGVCSSILHSVAGYKPIVLPSVSIYLVPMPVAWGLSSNPEVGWLERIAIAALCAILLIAIMRYAKGSYRVFENSYRIRVQRDDLNSRLIQALATAESANRAKTRFLAAASHDLRQPMHALSLFTGSLLLRPLDARSSSIADQIDNSVGALSMQLDALLDISKLDAGIVKPDYANIDLTMLVLQVTEDYRSQAEQKGLEVKLDVEESLRAMTDPVLLRRVLSNLISNAVKYTMRGSISVFAQHVGQYHCVKVIDTGSGIPQEEQEKIFEEFYQLENSERDRSQGLGLGLAIVRRLSEMLDLKLKMTSDVGVGTRISIDVLSVSEVMDSREQVLDAKIPMMPKLRILVIDDEESIQVGMRTLLEEMGFEVGVAGSTDAALELSKQLIPQLVLADYRLRGTDSGIKAIRELRSSQPGLPALLISGDNAPDRLREAHDAGIELLHKPVSSSRLRESILKAVSH